MATHIDMFEIIRQHKEDCEVFIESGTRDGQTTAIANLFFKEVHTIELSKYWYDFATNRFFGNPNIHVHFGDSAVILPQILKTINKRILFFLDGHYSAIPNDAKGEKSSPLIEELEAINTHDIKNHIILCDDMRLSGTVWIPHINDITKAILEINQNYRFNFMPSIYSSNEVLVAKLK